MEKTILDGVVEIGCLLFAMLIGLWLGHLSGVVGVLSECRDHTSFSYQHVLLHGDVKMECRIVKPKS